MQKRFIALSPLIKWAGGKEQELKYILPNIPKSFDRFIEPFVGGGAVYFSIGECEKLINDKSRELAAFYNAVKYNNITLVNDLQRLQNTWLKLEGFLSQHLGFFKKTYSRYRLSRINGDQLRSDIRNFLEQNKEAIKSLLSADLLEYSETFERELLRNIAAKLLRMTDLAAQKGDLPEKDVIDNFECSLKGSFYMFIRALYNKDHFKDIHFFYFIREYCYSSMFRYNANGGFNVPYGGISYNKKNLQRKIDYIGSNAIRAHFAKTIIFNLDFEDFLNEISPKGEDFIFLDPPYDTDFSNYANNLFDQEDQARLANFLINKCPARFMLVIKNTKFINSLYQNKGLFINTFDKKYLVSFKNRNNKDCEHLMISNYGANNSFNFKKSEGPPCELRYA